MDINNIAQLISTIGFPIAATCAIFYALLQEQKSHREEVDSLKGILAEVKETMASLKQLIEDKMK